MDTQHEFNFDVAKMKNDFKPGTVVREMLRWSEPTWTDYTMEAFVPWWGCFFVKFENKYNAMMNKLDRLWDSGTSTQIEIDELEADIENFEPTHDLFHALLREMEKRDERDDEMIREGIRKLAFHIAELHYMGYRGIAGMRIIIKKNKED